MPIIESPQKGPQVIWRPNEPTSDRPNDPRKVWLQPRPSALQLDASEIAELCDPTGAPMQGCSPISQPANHKTHLLLTEGLDGSLPVASVPEVLQAVLRTFPKAQVRAEGKISAPSQVPTKIIGKDPRTKPVSMPPPRNRKEALQSPWWDGYLEAEHAEMASHERNKTWELCPRSKVPPGCPVLLDRWAYDDKLAPGGQVIERFKARLTAMGCFQKAGVDYKLHGRSADLLQLYNNAEENSMDHWDVSTAFIHAPLKEQVWMRQASGHEVKGKEGYVCLLLKALYGTKQAAHAWQLHLKGLMVEQEFLSLPLDPATYVKRVKNAFVVVAHTWMTYSSSTTAKGSRSKNACAHLSSKLSIKTRGAGSVDVCKCASNGMLRQGCSNSPRSPS